MYSYNQVEVYTDLGIHWNDDSMGKFPQVTTCEFENAYFITECSIVEHYLKIEYIFRIILLKEYMHTSDNLDQNLQELCYMN
jgi:hypothetical protein